MSTPADFPYATFLDIKFPPLERIDVKEMASAVTHPWYNQTLCKVNDSVVRLGVMQGEYHWHKHDRDDEFFFVLDGLFVVDLEDRSIELGPRQGVTVPRRRAPHPRARSIDPPHGRDRGHRADGRLAGGLVRNHRRGGGQHRDGGGQQAAKADDELQGRHRVQARGPGSAANGNRARTIAARPPPVEYPVPGMKPRVYSARSACSNAAGAGSRAAGWQDAAPCRPFIRPS